MERNDREMNKRIITIIQILCVVVFVFSAYMIINKLAAGNKNDKMFEDIKDLIPKSPIVTSPTEIITEIPNRTVSVTPTLIIPTVTPERTPTDLPEKTPDFVQTPTPVLTPVSTPTPTTPVDVFDRTNGYKAVYEQNTDTIGWIKIEGTKIDYPVMQRKDEPNYYLKRDFYGNYSDYGVPYVMEECDVGTSDNLIIYGHHMKNGSMFSNLIYYQRKKLNYYNSHKDIQFDTFENGDATYRIFAAIEAGNDDDILHFISAENKEVYDKFISECKRRSLFDTGITPQYGDKLITLATCRFDWMGKINGKFLVIAVKI